MKKILLTTTLLLSIILSASAQSGLKFFTDDGIRFHVILNGEIQNQSLATNVSVTDLQATNYKLKIIFEEDSLGTIERNMPLEANKIYTFQVKRKKNSGTMKGLRRIGRQIDRDVKNREMNSEEEVDGEANNKYKLKFVSEEIVSAPAPTPQPQNNVQQNTAVNTGTNTTVTNTTSTTTTTNPGGGERVSMNINMNGMSTGVDVNVQESHYQQTTTTTSTTTGSSAATNDHYIMPGYSGAIGCPWPMHDNDFANAKQSIASKDFEDSKLTIAKQVTNANCLFAGQVKEIMYLFDFEDTKLEFAKFAYNKTYDINNYYQVNDAFEFESSIEELNAYIQSR